MLIQFPHIVDKQIIDTQAFATLIVQRFWLDETFAALFGYPEYDRIKISTSLTNDEIETAVIQTVKNQLDLLLVIPTDYKTPGYYNLLKIYEIDQSFVDKFLINIDELTVQEMLDLDFVSDRIEIHKEDYEPEQQLSGSGKDYGKLIAGIKQRSNPDNYENISTVIDSIVINDEKTEARVYFDYDSYYFLWDFEIQTGSWYNKEGEGVNLSKTVTAMYDTFKDAAMRELIENPTLNGNEEQLVDLISKVCSVLRIVTDHTVKVAYDGKYIQVDKNEVISRIKDALIFNIKNPKLDKLLHLMNDEKINQAAIANIMNISYSKNFDDDYVDSLIFVLESTKDEIESFDFTGSTLADINKLRASDIRNYGLIGALLNLVYDNYDRSDDRDALEDLLVKGLDTSKYYNLENIYGNGKDKTIPPTLLRQFYNIVKFYDPNLEWVKKYEHLKANPAAPELKIKYVAVDKTTYATDKTGLEFTVEINGKKATGFWQPKGGGYNPGGMDIDELRFTENHYDNIKIFNGGGNYRSYEISSAPVKKEKQPKDLRFTGEYYDTAPMGLDFVKKIREGLKGPTASGATLTNEFLNYFKIQ